ncbi:pre-mRNA-splicing factor SPF27-like [Lucilia sericata]|uniref:pre-mRNA-splicing factor SPF27-like n=1 Tax=Lucilia sericata TaxID=13632 RepID=UPI0018A87ACD|nr:pre-mRNA-splicing factor SPF27-like [Lucilia sericata]
MAGEVTVDALPYIDQGYDDPGVRESALAMVEECRRYRPTKNYLEHLPPLSSAAFETKLMAQEFERIQNRIPMETLSMKRYELPPPAAGRLSEVSAWEESIDNSKAQLEHQWVRTMNLELMLDYGIEAWKAYLEVFVALQAKAQNQLQALKKEIQDVNWQRKQAQTQAGEKLRTLEANWVLLVSKNYEIEQQCVELEKQIYTLRERIAENEKAKQLEEQSEQQLNGFSNNGEDGNSNSNSSETNSGNNDNTAEEDKERQPQEQAQDEDQEMRSVET